MIIAFLLGVAVGYILAIPPGPIGMASVRMGLRDGWHPSIRLAIGAGLLDLIYCALAMWASSAVVGLLTSLNGSTSWVTIALQFLIVAGMIAFGVVQFREHPIDPNAESDEQTRPTSLLSRLSSRGPFLVGVGFAVANLANPTFVPALMAMTTFIQQLDLFPSTFTNVMAFAVGFGAGNTAWLLTLVRLVIAFRRKMTPTFIHRLQQISGLALILFGCLTGYRVLAQLL
jgi:threonine/homoserine/homoserine lactone efflux protein